MNVVCKELFNCFFCFFGGVKLASTKFPQTSHRPFLFPIFFYKNICVYIFCYFFSIIFLSKVYEIG